MVNPDALSVKTAYDNNGNVLRQENENGGATTYQYDDANNLTGAESPGGRSLGWQYDERNRITERLGSGLPAIRYEHLGKRLHKIISPTGQIYELIHNNRAELVRLIHPGGRSAQWTYDDLGNVLTARDIKGNLSRYGYDLAGNLTYVAQPDGNEHRFSYDAAGNMIQAKDDLHDVAFTYGPLGTLTSRIQQGVAVRFGYDSELQLRNIFNEGSERYRFGLDGLGQVVNEWGFDGLERRYQRDGAGRVTQVLRPAGRFSNYQYDGTGHVILEEHHDGASAAYQYDKDGLLIKALNEHGTISIQRDIAGRVVGERQGDYAINKRYDENGQLQQTESSLGASIMHSHNESGHLQAMKAGSWEASWERDEHGLELQRQLSGGIKVETRRDRFGRVTGRSIGASGMESSRTRYEWGKGDRLHRLVNELTQASVNFDYDPFDNLVSADYTRNGELETIYRVPDRIGNLFKTKERNDRKYSAGGRLEQDTKFNYYYDAEGNLLFKEFRQSDGFANNNRKETEKELGIKFRATGRGWRYDWVGNGMLQRVKTPMGREVLFSYDPLGRRIAKQFKGMVTRWLWDCNVPLHEWQYEGTYPPQTLALENGDVALEKELVENMTTWVYEDGSFVPCAKIVGAESYSIVADYLGTPTHAYDSNGEKVWERELDIYGAVRKLNGDKDLIPQLYQGQWVDSETGLAYNRFRYYDAERGNYISQDPIRLEGNNPSLYGYVFDLNIELDPFALSCESKIKFKPDKIFPYSRGGGMSVLKHILQRHRLSTRYDDVSKFLTDSPKKIKKIIDEGVRNGMIDLNDRSVTYTFSKEIGKDVDGNLTKTIKIFYDEKGWVRTAFPF